MSSIASIGVSGLRINTDVSPSTNTSDSSRLLFLRLNDESVRVTRCEVDDVDDDVVLLGFL
jgi:hypothetical protein